MNDLYAGRTFPLSKHRLAEIVECGNCHNLIIRVDKDSLTEEDLKKIKEAKLRFAVIQLRRDTCEECDSNKHKPFNPLEHENNVANESA